MAYSTDQYTLMDPSGMSTDYSQWWNANGTFAPPQGPAPTGAPPSVAPPSVAPAAAPDRNALVTNYYNQYLGHAPSADALAQWANGPLKNEQIGPAIQASDEAKAYAAAQATPKPGPAPAAPAPFQPVAPDYSALFSASPSPLAGQNTANHDQLYSALSNLFNSGGGFNQDIVNRQNEAFREDLGRQRASTLKNDQAYLADRGLVGSGPEADALNYLDTNVANAYKNAASTNYANEEQQANQRMLSALQLATGMNENDAANLINGYQAQTSRALGLGNYNIGLGNLALGNENAANNYNLGVGTLGLNRDIAQNNMDNATIDQLIKLIEANYQGANQSAAGYF